MANNGLNVIIGTGALGLAVMDELLARGEQVRLVNRSGKAVVPAGVSVVAADVSDPAPATRVCEGASTIYYCAAPAYYEWQASFPKMTSAIIGAAANTGAKLIWADNLYRYGLPQMPITENSPAKPRAKKGVVRAQVADAVLNAHNSGKIKAAVAQASDFYGERVTQSSVGEQVFRAALAGTQADVLGDINTPHSFTYIRDFAKTMVTIAENDNALGQMWIAPTDASSTTKHFIESVFAAANQTPKFRAAPKPIVSIMALTNKNMREIKEMLYLSENPFVVDSSKATQVLGLTPTPRSEAIASTLAWYRANPSK